MKRYINVANKHYARKLFFIDARIRRHNFTQRIEFTGRIIHRGVNNEEGS